MDNRQIADRLEAFAALLELSDANPYTTRAYRRAAETVRGAPLPVARLVRSGRVRDLRVAEVVRKDLTIENGAVTSFRVRLGISFKYESGD